jgi:hypothetical protein
VGPANGQVPVGSVECLGILVVNEASATGRAPGRAGVSLAEPQPPTAWRTNERQAASIDIGHSAHNSGSRKFCGSCVLESPSASSIWS